jgi:hypothetical protein
VNNITLDPCVEQHMADYLNLPNVQAAIHAIVCRRLLSFFLSLICALAVLMLRFPCAHALQPTNWVQCSTVLHYSRTDLLTSMMPVYETLLATGEPVALRYECSSSQTCASLCTREMSTPSYPTPV